MSKEQFINEFNPVPTDVALCGSMAHKDKWLKIIDELRAKGLSVSTPDLSEAIDWSALSDDEVQQKKGYFVRRHFANIATAKNVLVCNYEKHGTRDYIGTNTLLEMGVAFAYGVPTYILNEIPEQNGREEILALQPHVLHGDLSVLGAAI
jgi:hypothetical protein